MILWSPVEGPPEAKKKYGVPPEWERQTLSMSDSPAPGREAKKAVREMWGEPGRGKHEGVGCFGRRGKTGKENRVVTGESATSELVSSFPRLGDLISQSLLMTCPRVGAKETRDLQRAV